MTATAISTASSTAATEPVILQIDPKTLLLDCNVRTQVALDPEFVASIGEHGVLVPIVAVRTAEDRLRVRYGQRRTLAAIKAERQLVTVVVIGDENTTTDAAAVTRIVQQFHENEHRAGLGVTDQVGAVSQLAAFGLDADTIANQLGQGKATVRQALTVAGSKLASKSTARYDLTLDQAAVVADFEQSPQVVTALVAAAKKSPGEFDHVAQRARDQRADEQFKAAIVAKLAKAKVRLVKANDHIPKLKALSGLVSDAAGTVITPAAHKKCPGHAAILERHWGKQPYETVYVCTDWRAHGHRDRYSSTGSNVPAAALTEAEREHNSAERRAVIANNKAWLSAEKVRRAWLTQFLTHKTAPRSTQLFIATELAHASHELGQALEHNGAGMLHQLLGVKDHNGLLTMTARATEGRAQVLTLAFVLAAYEARTSKDTWRRPSSGMVRYFAHLAALGYELSDVEKLTQPQPKRTRAATSPAAETTASDGAEPGPAADAA